MPTPSPCYHQIESQKPCESEGESEGGGESVSERGSQRASPHLADMIPTNTHFVSYNLGLVAQ